MFIRILSLFTPTTTLLTMHSSFSTHSQSHSLHIPPLLIILLLFLWALFWPLHFFLTLFNPISGPTSPKEPRFFNNSFVHFFVTTYSSGIIVKKQYFYEQHLHLSCWKSRFSDCHTYHKELNFCKVICINHISYFFCGRKHVYPSSGWCCKHLKKEVWFSTQ